MFFLHFYPSSTTFMSSWGTGKRPAASDLPGEGVEGSKKARAGTHSHQPHDEGKEERKRYEEDCISYFSDPQKDGSYKFFRDEEEMGSFTLLLNTSPRIKSFLTRTVKAFYGMALKDRSLNDGELKSFFSDTIPRCNQEAVLADYKEWKRIFNHDSTQSDTTSNLPRVVKADFMIKKTQLSHNCDLESFSKHVDLLFDWYNHDPQSQPEYVGPYFCFVQSSGMGKTKLMYEYKQKQAKKNDQVAAYLVLPKYVKTANEADKVFDGFYDFNETIQKIKKEEGDFSAQKKR